MKLPRNFQFDFQRKRVLVTGAGKGIGREIARMLHSFNAHVVALSRTESDLQSLEEEINCQAIVAELGDPEAARRAAEQAGDIGIRRRCFCRLFSIERRGSDVERSRTPNRWRVSLNLVLLVVTCFEEVR